MPLYGSIRGPPCSAMKPSNRPQQSSSRPRASSPRTQVIQEQRPPPVPAKSWKNERPAIPGGYQMTIPETYLKKAPAPRRSQSPQPERQMDYDRRSDPAREQRILQAEGIIHAIYHEEVKQKQLSSHLLMCTVMLTGPPIILGRLIIPVTISTTSLNATSSWG